MFKLFPILSPIVVCLAMGGVAAAQSLPPSYRSPTCNAFCDLVTAIQKGAPSVHPAETAAAAPEAVAAPAIAKPVAASAPSKGQLHLVAGAKIASLSDLDGKSVSLGLNGSESQRVGRFVLKRAGVKINEVPLDLDNALDALGTGVVSGVLVVAPKPVKVLAGIPSKAGLHLVPISAAVSVARTRPTIIGSSDYPALTRGSDVRTVEDIL